MSATNLPPDLSDADEELRRLEARVVSGDRALQRQADAVLAVAARRAERTATWAAVALAGVAALFVLNILMTRGGARARRRRA